MTFRSVRLRGAMEKEPETNQKTQRGKTDVSGLRLIRVCFRQRETEREAEAEKKVSRDWLFSHFGQRHGSRQYGVDSYNNVVPRSSRNAPENEM